MGRPSASTENRERAILFAKGVTCVTKNNSDIIARSGSFSLFSAFARCAPSLVRVDSTSKRDSISELEFNKELQRVGFLRLRDRRSVAKNKKDDPNGVGLYLFCKRRWLDPANKEDRHALVKCWNGLVDLEESFEDECPLEEFLSIVAEIRTSWIPKTARKRAARMDSSNSHSDFACEDDESCRSASPTSAGPSRETTPAQSGMVEKVAKKRSARTSRREAAPAVEAVEIDEDMADPDQNQEEDAEERIPGLRVDVHGLNEDINGLDEVSSAISSSASCDGDFFDNHPDPSSQQWWPSTDLEDPSFEISCPSDVLENGGRTSYEASSSRIDNHDNLGAVCWKEEQASTHFSSNHHYQLQTPTPQAPTHHGYSSLSTPSNFRSAWVGASVKSEAEWMRAAVRSGAEFTSHSLSQQPHAAQFTAIASGIAAAEAIDGWQPADDSLVLDVMNAMRQF